MSKIPPNGQVSHMFPCNFQNHNPFVQESGQKWTILRIKWILKCTLKWSKMTGYFHSHVSGELTWSLLWHNSILNEIILEFKTNKSGAEVPKHTTSRPNTTVIFVINFQPSDTSDQADVNTKEASNILHVSHASNVQWLIEGDSREESLYCEKYH